MKKQIHKLRSKARNAKNKTLELIGFRSTYKQHKLIVIEDHQSAHLTNVIDEMGLEYREPCGGLGAFHKHPNQVDLWVDEVLREINTG